MKLFKKLKKGFTLVELVVVIAVIAILAAISVVSYIGVTNKAKAAADSEIITQLNTQMRAKSIMDGPNKTAYEAYLDAKEIGFNLELMKPSSSGEFVWDQENDLFACVEVSEDNKTLGKVIAEDKSKGFANIPAKSWVFTSSINKTAKYCQYLNSKDKNENVINAPATIEVESGFDAGENMTVKAIEYKSNAGHSVVIRTNSDTTTLKVTDTTDSKIMQYGDCGIIEAEVGMNSLYIEGHVNFVEAKAGHIVANGLVDAMYTSATSLDAVKVEGNVTHAHASSEAGATALNENTATKAVTWDYDGDNETTNNHPDVAEGTTTADSMKDEVAAIAVNNSLETPIEGEARILKVGYPTLKEAIEAAQPGQVVVLLKDITLNSTLTAATYKTSYLIEKSITIDGANYMIDAKYSGSGTNVFCVKGDNLKISFKNLTIDGSAERAIQSWSPSTDNLDLTVDNCSLYATAYTLRINEAINANVKIINNTKIYGWGCIYAKASTNSTYLIQDSYIGGINDKTEASSNGFGTIVLEGADPYNPTLDPVKGKNNTVNILRSRIVAERRNGNTQEWLNLNYGIRDSVINVDDSTIIENEKGKDVSREVGRSMAYDYWSKSYQANCTINFNGTSWKFDSYVTLEKGETEICCGTLNEAMSKASNGDTIRVESNTFEKINNVNVNVCFAVFTYDAADTTYNDNMEVNGYTVLNQVIDTINIDGDDYEMTGYYSVKDSNVLDNKIIGGTYYFDLTELVHDGYHIVDNGNGTWTVVAD